MSASLYKVAFIGDDGHARHTEQIQASSDDEAVELAQGKLDAMEVLALADIWLDSERVAILARQKRVRPQHYAAA
jgi:hypothetical protein